MNDLILVVDDDPLLCKGLKFNLEKAGYEVITATNSYAATEQVRLHPFKAAVLDIGLPGEDGLSLCHYLKSHYSLPVIFLTGRQMAMDEIIGLEIGGDDYITKPFNIDVFLARLKNVLRRQKTSREDHPEGVRQAVNLGSFHLDPTAHLATQNGQPLSLTPREFDLLYFFLNHPEQVFTTDEIIEAVWGADFVGEPQVVYVQVRSLREKIEAESSNPRHLVTLRGVGYKFLS
jgi:DNA-binding response OmpR family regulator